MWSHKIADWSFESSCDANRCDSTRFGAEPRLSGGGCVAQHENPGAPRMLGHHAASQHAIVARFRLLCFGVLSQHARNIPCPVSWDAGSAGKSAFAMIVAGRGPWRRITTRQRGPYSHLGTPNRGTTRGFPLKSRVGTGTARPRTPRNPYTPHLAPHLAPCWRSWLPRTGKGITICRGGWPGWPGWEPDAPHADSG